MSRTAVLQLAQLVDGADDLELLERMVALLLVEDHDLLERLGIAEPDPEHEPVELGLGKGERSLVLDRVLGRDHEERVRHRVGRAVDRRLPLLHRFEEARLGLRRRPVDLVGEDDLAHDRAGPELELLGLLVVDRQAGHVRREEVRRELDAPEAAAQAPRDRLGKHGLAGAGNVLDQQVAAAEQRDEGQPDLVMLADDHVLDVGEDLLSGLLEVRHRAPRGMGVTGSAPGDPTDSTSARRMRFGAGSAGWVTDRLHAVCLRVVANPVDRRAPGGRVPRARPFIT